MNIKLRKLLLILLALIAIAVVAADKQENASATMIDEADQWEQRLESLTPANPLAYFELAEEIADAANDEYHRKLAQHLFALSGVLDPINLGRSACLALADMESRVHHKQRLLALSDLLDERGGSVAWVQTTQVKQISPSAALAVSEALSHYRKGNGNRAIAALNTPGATELLEAAGGVLRGGVQRFIEDCKLYRSGRSPTIASNDLLSMLQLEAALLAGDNRTWSADEMFTDARPLLEVDPDNLQQTLLVDGSKAYYRNGQWVSAEMAR